MASSLFRDTLVGIKSHVGLLGTLNININLIYNKKRKDIINNKKNQDGKRIYIFLN